MRAASLSLFAAFAVLLPALGAGLTCYVCDSRMNSACANDRPDLGQVPSQQVMDPNAVCYALQGRRPPGAMGGIIEESGVLRGVMLQKDLDIIAATGELTGLDLFSCNKDFCTKTSGSTRSVMNLGLCATLIIVAFYTNGIL